MNLMGLPKKKLLRKPKRYFMKIVFRTHSLITGCQGQTVA